MPGVTLDGVPQKLYRYDVDDTPVDGAVDVPPSSNRMFDHEADIDAHMAEFTQSLLIGWYDYGVYNPLSGGSDAVVGNTIYFRPFFVPRARTYDRIAIELTVVGAGGTVVRLGIYRSSAAHIPTTLVVDAGTVAVDAGVAVKTITISEQLTKGNYFMAHVSDGTPEFRSIIPRITFLGAGTGGILDGRAHQGYTKAAVGIGALADPAVTGLTLTETELSPVVLRVLTND